MSRLSQSLRKAVRQGNMFSAIVLDAYGDKASVRLSNNGAIYKGLDVVGNKVIVGQNVRVSFASSKPLVYASPANIPAEEPVYSRARPLEPIAHMNTDFVPGTSGSGIGGGYSTVDHRYIFAPALGGTSAFDHPKDPLDRMAFGAGPYSGGSNEIDYMGVSFYSGAVRYVYSMFACPFDVLTVTITPVAQLNVQLGSNQYLYFEARSYPAYFTAFGSPSNSSYAETTLIATILPFFRLLTELQLTFTTIDSGDIWYLYLYGSGSGSESFYMIGFWIELIGVP